MNKLPIAPTATTFCSAEIPLWDGLQFFCDGNSKITRSNGTFEAPQPNAFSLPAASVPVRYPGASPRPCPGSTPTCRASCYVKGLAAHAPELYTRYEQNAEALAVVLDDPHGRLWNAAAHKLARWIVDNARGGFRWHVSGDVLSLAHAQWIAEVCHRARPVHFWIYTRTLIAVQTLCQIKNLAVNVSADVDNYAAARTIATAHGARVCYLTEDGSLPADLPPGSVIFPDYSLRKREGSDWFETLSHEQRTQVCPADLFGQSESARCGVCVKCF